LFHGRVCAPFFRSLPLAATLAAGSASAQPVTDEFVSGARVSATKECALLRVNFHARVRYAGHFPQDVGDELRISIRLIDREFPRQLRNVRREGVRVDNSDLAGIQAVTLDLDQVGGPVLRVQFAHPSAYQVTQLGNFESIGVVVPRSGSAKKCKLSDFGIPAAAEQMINQSVDDVAVSGGPIRTGGTVGGKLSSADVKIIESLMDEARAALKKNRISEAIALWKKVLKFPENQYSAEAQEMIGVALQKAGKTAAARAEFEDYLRRYPQGEGNERVTQRLNALLTASGESPERLRGGSPNAAESAISDKAASAKSERRDETIWTASGSISSFYTRNDSINTAKDITLAPNPNADPDAHRTHQNTILSNFDMSGSIVNSQVKTKFKIAATDEHRLELDNFNRDRYGISTALIESTFKEYDLTLAFGRMSRNTSGVIGRFDGGVGSWRIDDRFRLNVVAGSPNLSRFDAPFKDGKYLFGASVDVAKVVDGLDTSLFVIEQHDRWILDRRAVGAEFRYFNQGVSALGTIDYDIYFKRLNAVIFSGSYTFDDKSVLTAALDYRRVPYLSTWNAIQGQPFLTLYDMLKFNTQGDVRRFALDRTPIFKSATASYSRPLNENFQVSVDGTVTKLSGTPPSGGVDGTMPTGTEYYLSAQLIGSNLFQPGDMFIGAVRYASLADSKVYFLDLNTRYPLRDDLRISPRLRFGFRNGTTAYLKETTILPSLLLNYLLTKDIGLEAEIGYKWMRTYQDAIRSQTHDLFLTVGLRSDFNTEGMYRCAGILAPCVGMLMGPARMDEHDLAHEKAHYGNALFDQAAPDVTSAFVIEGGFRYWYSRGGNKYDYFADQTSALRVSRLSYTNLAAHSGELFFRADARQGLIRNFFIKGYIGGGGVSGGKLSDEDFPPIISPYSKTISSAAGSLRYGSIDLGYNVYTDERIRVGAFVGFHSWLESVDARGCTQVGLNPFICGIPLPAGSVKLVSEKDRWNSLRVGTVVDVNVTDRLKWTGEAAIISTSARPVDTHYFTFGVDPASGHGGGFQAESILQYQVTDNFSLGVGARWWHLKTQTTDRFWQLQKYQTDRFGVFVQGSYRFNLGTVPVATREGL
jgi:TolA-binding protein